MRRTDDFTCNCDFLGNLGKSINLVDLVPLQDSEVWWDAGQHLPGHAVFGLETWAPL